MHFKGLKANNTPVWIPVSGNDTNHLDIYYGFRAEDGSTNNRVINITDQDRAVLRGLGYKLTIDDLGYITEDFTGGTFDSANFELGGGSGNATDAGWASVTNRGTLRTVASNLKPSIDNPLTIEADITFTPANEIAFLQVRGDGLPSGSFDEPSNGIYLRLHNFQNGHTGVSFGDPFMEVFRKDPPGGDSFWDDPVHLLLTDDGSTISVTLTNTVTNVVNTFSINDKRSSGGYVAFSTSANGARWDNISITHNNLTDK